MNDVVKVDPRAIVRDLALRLEVSNEYVVPDGLARSIWEDKYAREIETMLGTTTRFETWGERLRQVAAGNFLLLPDDKLCDRITTNEFRDMIRLSVEGVMCYSGRQLQHGDFDQPKKLLDLFSNCATSPFSFLTLWKSLCGKGVSSDYSSHMRPVNWDNVPYFRVILDGGSDDSGDVSKGAHPDFLRAQSEFQGGFESLRDAEHKYPSDSEWVRWFKVEDSREGWAQVVCALETAAYHERHKDKLFLFDFSAVREAGKPIMGHQGRPASGPIPLMRCLLKVASIKGAFMSPWKQAMFIDDYLAQCVSIGGVRRNARMAVMWWRDSNILEFIQIKRGGHLRMANNTILVDEEFWEQRKDPRTHAHMVFQQAIAAAYYDNTGEPGFANVHNMRQNREGMENLTAENYLNLEATGLKLHAKTYDLMSKVIAAVKRAPYICIPNPCGEADLMVAGDDCLVGDLGLHRARSQDDAVRAGFLMGKALVRISGLMPAICHQERKRTNRIGGSAVGILEYFWNHHRLGFYDLLSAHDHFIYEMRPVDISTTKDVERRAIEAWNAFGDIAAAIREGAVEEALTLGLPEPDTATLLKPGGTVAKAVQAMESANLPNRRYYLRYTQHPKYVVVDGKTVLSPKVAEYERRGYPVNDISHKYPGYVVVGFPTVHPYVRMMDEAGAGHLVVTANNIPVEDHFKWLRLLEYHWLGTKANGEPQGGQIAYTMKYNPKQVGYEEFMQLVAENQSTIRCCTFAVCSSDEDVSNEIKELVHNYGWAPETPIDQGYYDYLVARIEQAGREEYDSATEACETGVCAIDENIR